MVDMAAVVRCKYCKHKLSNSERWCERIWCKKLSAKVTEEFFCGFGDEKEQEDK